MKYLFAALLFSSISVFSACSSTPSAPPTLAHQHYTFAGSTRCDTTGNTGVDVSVSYILLTDDTDGARKINDSLRFLAAGSVVGWLDSATVGSNPEARTNLVKAATLFASDYQAMRKDMGSIGGCWELKTNADTVHASSKALTVKFDTYAYTGGAHPNSNLSFYTFNRKTGAMLTLADMVSDTTALLNLAEKTFRKQQRLPPNASLEEQGYFLHDGQFFLPANVGMSQQGLVLYYNPYEIAAYAVGPIQVTVPYDQLGGIIHKDWL